MPLVGVGEPRDVSDILDYSRELHPQFCFPKVHRKVLEVLVPHLLDVLDLHVFLL